MRRQEKFLIFDCLFWLKQCPFSDDFGKNNSTYLSKDVKIAHCITDAQALILRRSMSIVSKEAQPWFAATGEIT